MEESIDWVLSQYTSLSREQATDLVEGIAYRLPAPPKLPNLAQAKAIFRNWVDDHRFWAHPGGNVYEWLEELAEVASWAFRGERRPRPEDMEMLEKGILHFSHTHAYHPDWYNGPCQCNQCRLAD